MGMFDHVRCLSPLLSKQYAGQTFQTKSLECMMDDYVITEDGLLKRESPTWGSRKSEPPMTLWVDEPIWLTGEGVSLRANFLYGRLMSIETEAEIQERAIAFEREHNGGKSVAEIIQECEKRRKAKR